MTNEERHDDYQRWQRDWAAVYAALDALGKHAHEAQQRASLPPMYVSRYGQLRLSLLEAENRLRSHQASL